MMAGSDTLNGAASSLTDSPGSTASRITSARRVGSASAPNVRSRVASETLTIWLSIEAGTALSTVPWRMPDRRAAGPGFSPDSSALNPGRCKLASIMDMSLVTALLGAQTGMTQLAVAGRLARMNADQGAAIAKLVDAAARNMSSLANVAAGIGGKLDISA